LVVLGNGKKLGIGRHGNGLYCRTVSFNNSLNIKQLRGEDEVLK